MNARTIELALRKQRLQLRAEAEREELAHHLSAVDSVLDTADRVRDCVHDNLQWAREKVPLLSIAALVLLAVHPRKAFRLARTGWIGWMLWHRLRGRRSTLLNPSAAAALLRLLAGVRTLLGAGGRRN